MIRLSLIGLAALCLGGCNSSLRKEIKAVESRHMLLEERVKYLETDNARLYCISSNIQSQVFDMERRTFANSWEKQLMTDRILRFSLIADEIVGTAEQVFGKKKSK